MDKPRTRSIALFDDDGNDARLCVMFGEHCRLGILRLQTTVITAVGIPKKLTGTLASRRMICRMMHRMLHYRDIKPEHLTIHQGKLWNKATAKFMPSHACSIAIDADFDELDMRASQQRADEKKAMGSQWQLSSSAVRRAAAGFANPT